MASTQTSPPIFAGEFRHALDNKNRITIPAVWRQSDSDPFFLIADPSGDFLIAMPPGEFQKVSEKLQNRVDVPPQEVRIFLREFYSRARQCATDRQGRLLLPEEHCRQVGLQGEVVLVGSFGRFEIWSPAARSKAQEIGNPTFERVAGLVL